MTNEARSPGQLAQPVQVDFIGREEGVYLIWSHMYLPMEEWRDVFMTGLKVALGMPAVQLRNGGGGRWIVDQDDLDLYAISQREAIDRMSTYIRSYFAKAGRASAFTTSMLGGER